VIYGLEAEEMPDGWTPLEAVAILKCLDETGDVALLLRSTEALRVWDAVGMLTCALDTERAHSQQGFISEDEDDDPPRA
jgi:hypothetical protein